MLNTVTVPIKEKVVHAVLHFFSAETLYKNLWIPKAKRAIIVYTYHDSMRLSSVRKLKVNYPAYKAGHLKEYLSLVYTCLRQVNVSSPFTKRDIHVSNFMKSSYYRFP